MPVTGERTSTMRQDRASAVVRARSDDAAWAPLLSGVYLAVVAVSTLAFVRLPAGGTAQAWLFVGVHASLVVAIAAGTLRYRPPHAGTWWLILAGQAVDVAANVVWYLGPVVAGWTLSFPSVADALQLSADAILAVGLWRLALLRAALALRSQVIDVLVVTLSVGAVVWLYLMAPYALDATLPLGTRLIALDDPTFDVVLVAILATLLVLPGVRPPAFWLLTGGLVATLAADVHYATESLAGTFTYGEHWFVLWLALYGLFGAAVLHPSMVRLTEPTGSVQEDDPGRWRFWAMPAVLSVGLLALALHEYTEGRFDQIPVPIALTVAALLVASRHRQLTAELVERERVQSSLEAGRDAALEASRAKSDFLATMSHEIRTPMNAVIGMTGLLEDTELDDEQHRYVTGIRSAGETLLSLINDILDFSKIEAGRVELEEVEFDIQRLVEEVADLFTPAAADHGVAIYSFVQPAVPRLVRGDAGRLRQVLVNVVSNAVKFTPEGKIIIRVSRAAGRSRPGRQPLLLEVADTGVGIPAEAQERIFEAFTQADASDSRRHGGTGLGLAISARLIELLGGHIDLASTPGVGTTFRFTVDLGAVPGAPTGRPTEPLVGARLLVADRDATNRDLITRQARAWQMHVSAATDGQGALHLLSTAATADRPFTMVLVDEHLPEHGGLDLARRITGDGRFGEPRVAIMAAAPSGELRAACSEAAVTELLIKPVRQSHLFDTLVNLALPELGGPDRERPTSPVRRPSTLGGRLLLVEDNPANQLVGSRIVEKLGYQVDVVADGSEALDALSLRPYDGVLMDCQMPYMDGFEATRRLREREGEGRRTPVIAMTAGVTTEDRERCYAAGMDDFVGKPVLPQALAEVLERWIGTPERTRGGPHRTDERPQRPRGSFPHPDRDVIDPDRWDELYDLVIGDHDTLTTVVRLFLDDAPDRIAAITQAHATGDGTRLAAASHGLKGAAANLGATHLAAIAARLEHAAENDHVPVDPTVLDQLTTEFERVRTALRAYLGDA